MAPDVGVVLDAGPFLALERRHAPVTHLVERFARNGTPLVTSAGVVAQVWSGGGQRQAPIAFLLRRVVVVDLTYHVAKHLGRVLGMRNSSDPIDAHVAFLARERGWPVLTSDPDDILEIDPSLVVERI